MAPVESSTKRVLGDAADVTGVPCRLSSILLPLRAGIVWDCGVGDGGKLEAGLNG